MNRKFKVAVVIIVIISLLLLGWWIFTSSQSETLPTPKANNLANSENLDEMYNNSEFNFSFKKPYSYSIGEFGDNDAKTILIQPGQNKDSIEVRPQQNQGAGFQILITPFDELNAVITQERINKEIPNMKVESVKEISITGKDTQGNPVYLKGLEFESDNPVFGGSSTEIWFVYSGNLYQLSGYPDSMPIMEEVIKTWKFQ